MAAIANAVSGAISGFFNGGMKVITGLSSDLLGPSKPEVSDAPAPKPAAAAPAGNVGPQNADIQARSSQLATLEQTIGQRAAAAGSVRNDNEADILGAAPPAKRRAASRTLLG